MPPGPDEAEHATADLEALLGEGAVSLYPQRESLPYEAAETHVEIGGLRVEALEALLTGRAAILVTTARALQELSPAVAGLDDLQLELRAGQAVRPPELAERLEAMGFERVATVEEVGQFALRGGILDVFGFGAPEPARIEFWGDEVESIRHFDVLSQLSVGRTADSLRSSRWTCATPRRRPERAAPDGADGSAAPSSTTSPRTPCWSTSTAPPRRRSGSAPGTRCSRLHHAESPRGAHPEPPERLFLAGRRRSPPGVAALPALFVGRGRARRGPARGARFRVLPPEPIDRDMQPARARCCAAATARASGR